MAPPPISPIDTNWFQDATWTGTITPALTTAQASYTAALTAAQSYYTTSYSPSRQTLRDRLDGPLTNAAELAALDAARSDFAVKRAQYATLLDNLQTSSEDLIAAFRAAQSHVDTEGDTLLDSYVTQLASEVGLQLTRIGVDTSTLATELTSANTARNLAKSDFTSELDTYQTAENELSQARVDLQVLEDQKLSAEADVAYWTLKLQLDTNAGAPAAVIANDQAELSAANANYASLSAQVTAQQAVVVNKESARTSSKTALNSALSDYTSAIDDLLDKLEDGYDTHFGIPAQFAQSLQDERDDATSIVEAAYQQQIIRDNNLKATLLSAFPTSPPSSITTQIENDRVATVETIATVIRNFDGSQVTKALASISVPDLPPAGTMSINDLMRFIAAIQLVISRLEIAIRQADNAVDSLRMRVWDLQGAEITKMQATLYGWALQIIQADQNYNMQVALDNAQTSEEIVNALNMLLTDPDTIAAIQDAIAQLNSEIDDQNRRGEDVTTALNNSNYIAVDTINENQNIQPSITNTADIFELDADTPYPPARTDVAEFANPDTIPHYPDYTPSDYLPIPSTFPVPQPTVDTDPGVQPDPNNPTILVPPDPSVLPNPAQVNNLNEIVENINAYLYPIRERLAAAGVNFELIDKFLLRAYTEVRQITDVINIDDVTSAFKIYSELVQRTQLLREHAELTDKGKALSPFERALDASRVAVTEGQHATSEPVGAGAGILSANILASSARVGQAVQGVLNSTNFNNTISNILESAALIGGLATLTQFPTSIANYSQMGIARSELAGEVGKAAEARVQAAGVPAGVTEGELSETEKLVALQTVTSLIGAANDTAGLRGRAVELIRAQGQQGLSEEEIQNLIAALIYILQLLLLLVAALLVAAVGGETLPQVLQKVFEKPKDVVANKVIQDLRDLGVERLDTLTPSAPDFVESFANAIVPLFSTSQRGAFVAQVTQSFTSRSVSVRISTEEAELGTSLADALRGAPIDVRGQIRQEIIRSEIENAELVKQDVARREIQRLATVLYRPAVSATRPTAVTTQAVEAELPEGVEQAPRLAGVAEAQAPPPPLPTPQTIQNVVRNLQAQAPEIQGLSNDDRNVIVLAVATQLISASQGLSLVKALVAETNVGGDQTLAFLQARATQEGRTQRTGGSSRPGVTIATPAVPVSAGIVGDVAAPQVLPKDHYDLLRDAFLNLSLQSDNKDFTEEAAFAFAKNIEPLTNFFQRSLSLILDPGSVIVRNFSIFTKDGTLASRQTPLVIGV